MGVCVMGDQGTWGKACVWVCGYSHHPKNPGEECGEMQGSFHLFIQQKFTIEDLLCASSFSLRAMPGTHQKTKALRELLVQSRRELTHYQRVTAQSDWGWGGGKSRHSDWG